MQRNETNLREALHLATSSDYQTRLYAVEVLTDGIEELLLLRPTLAALTAERARLRAVVRAARLVSSSVDWVSGDQYMQDLAAALIALDATTPPAAAGGEG